MTVQDWLFLDQARFLTKLFPEIYLEISKKKMIKCFTDHKLKLYRELTIEYLK